MFIVNVEGAICRDDKWLVITRSTKEEHAGGTLSLIGGKVDVEGNTLEILERTVKREIDEEVGIEIKDTVTFVYSSSLDEREYTKSSASKEIKIMMKNVYVVRHCKADGQEPGARLTELGNQQAEILAQFFLNKNIDCIISSPFERAYCTISPLADKIGVEVVLDDRLAKETLIKQESSVMRGEPPLLPFGGNVNEN